MEDFDAIVVGSGPAGYTAAIYLARAQVKVLVLEGAQYGGALMGTTEVENFPGFPDGIMGPELMERMRTQAGKFGAILVSADVTHLRLDGPVKTVCVGATAYTAKTVVMATGSVSRRLGLEKEQELSGRGVSSCATCDGFFFRGHDIAVVGGGDSAMEEALFLTRFARSVTLIHRNSEFRASAIMLDRVREHEAIRIMTDTEVVRLHGDETLSAVTLLNRVTGETSHLGITGLFVAIGHDPQSGLLKNDGGATARLSAHGHVEVIERSARTSIPGVFACGDLVDADYRQAIFAAGSGCAAGLDAQHFLTELLRRPADVLEPA
jgi:thioredoxin reductase (NADPH)